ncbi:MAG: shikimate dehydrogenase, partial [Candidatus Bathyarchaeia archaeon]
YVYVAFNVKKENLEKAVSGMRSLNMHGLNVTMPHKMNVIQYLDQIDETAKNIGSVNTVLNKEGILIGYSTDGIGALNALKYNKVSPSNKKIVILGAGGASRAVSFNIAKESKELVVLNRTVEKAENLVKDLSSLLGKSVNVKARSLKETNLKTELEGADIVINATSIGMHPRENETPINPILLRPSMVVFDLVYDPFETRLLKDAKKVGAKTINGLDMLIHQGASSFEIWTGKKAPVEVMMKAAMAKLKAKKEK